MKKVLLLLLLFVTATIYAQQPNGKYLIKSAVQFKGNDASDYFKLTNGASIRLSYPIITMVMNNYPVKTLIVDEETFHPEIDTYSALCTEANTKQPILVTFTLTKSSDTNLYYITMYYDKDFKEVFGCEKETFRKIPIKK